MKIAQLGQPVLWQKAEPVPPEEIHTPAFQSFLAEMLETLKEAKGAGLAAPQVFSSRRVFLAAVLPPIPPEESPEVETFINPRIVAASEESVWGWEGCLSFDELLVYVERRQAVRVEYLNARGEAKTLDLVDFPARVIQHEYDHLDGILTVDRAPTRRHIIKASEVEDYVKALKA